MAVLHHQQIRRLAGKANDLIAIFPEVVISIRLKPPPGPLSTNAAVRRRSWRCR
jgi:hypothetical protein